MVDFARRYPFEAKFTGLGWSMLQPTICVSPPIPARLNHKEAAA